MNASASEETDFEVEENPEIRAEDEFYNTYEDSGESEDLGTKDLLHVLRKRTSGRTQKLQDKLRGAWNMGFRKRAFSTPDFQFDKRAKSKSFMDAMYGKRRGRLPFETLNFGKRLNKPKQQHSDLEF